MEVSEQGRRKEAAKEARYRADGKRPPVLLESATATLFKNLNPRQNRCARRNRLLHRALQLHADDAGNRRLGRDQGRAGEKQRFPDNVSRSRNSQTLERRRQVFVRVRAVRAAKLDERRRATPTSQPTIRRRRACDGDWPVVGLADVDLRDQDRKHP